MSETPELWICGGCGQHIAAHARCSTCASDSASVERQSSPDGTEQITFRGQAFPSFEAWVSGLIAYVEAGPAGEMWTDVVYALSRQQHELRQLRAHVAPSGDDPPVVGREAPDDGGVAETERRHSADCRAQEAQRTREAADLDVGREAPRTPEQTGELQEQQDEPSVMGAGGGLSPMPSRSEAEAVWRRFYVDRMVERGVDRESAQACCAAGDADLSINPADAADDELQYWAADDEGK